MISDFFCLLFETSSHPLARASLTFMSPPASASRVLGLQVRAAIPSSLIFLRLYTWLTWCYIVRKASHFRSSCLSFPSAGIIHRPSYQSSSTYILKFLSIGLPTYLLYVCWDQRTTGENQISPSIVGPRAALRSSVQAAGASTCWAIW